MKTYRLTEKQILKILDGIKTADAVIADLYPTRYCPKLSAARRLVYETLYATEKKTKGKKPCKTV